MVNNEDYSDVIIKTRLGKGTSDEEYQTADGRWWKDWRGERIGTGQEIKRLRKPCKDSPNR